MKIRQAFKIRKRMASANFFKPIETPNVKQPGKAAIGRISKWSGLGMVPLVSRGKAVEKRVRKLGLPVSEGFGFLVLTKMNGRKVKQDDSTSRAYTFINQQVQQA